jgi:DNA polymerase III subunit gamma/tau
VLRGLLEEILASEGVKYEPAVVQVVVRAGAGSARDALSILDQLLAGSDESGLTYERAVSLLGYTDESLLDDVAEAFAAGDGSAVFRAVNRVIEGGHDPRRFATDLLDRFRDLIVLAAVPDAGQTGLLDVPADRLDRMREQAASFDQAQLARAAEIINAGLVEMRGATSPRLQLELICAQVLLPAAATGDAGLLARLERLERRLGSGEAPHRPEQRESPTARPAAAAVQAQRPEPVAPPPRPARPEPPAEPAPRAGASAAADVGSVRERWPEILDAVGRRSRVAWVQLNSATAESLQDGVLTLRFAQAGAATGFTARGSDQDLVQVLGQMLGITPRIRAVAAEPGASRGRRDPSSESAGPDIEDSARHATPPPAQATAADEAPARPARPDAPPPPPRERPAQPEEPDHDDSAASALTGVDLIQRTLGGQVIEEIGDA